MLLPELKARQADGQIIRVGVVGAGQMGEGLVTQIEQVYGMRVDIVADVVPDRSRQVLESAGVDPSAVVETDDPAEAAAAISEGRRVASTNPDVAWVKPIDVAVEATGVPDVGAHVAHGAIAAGTHVMQMNVETDATVGYLLRKLAKEAGVIYSLTAGDEPGSTMELVDFARVSGFEVTCAGKGKNNPLDRTANPDTVAEKAADQRMNPKMLASFVDGTKTMVEMTSLGNAIGFAPDVTGMHGPEVGRDELAKVFVPKSEGGILDGSQVVEYGRGIAPGVFVVFTADHPKIRRDLEYLSMGPGPYWALYRPYHLTSLETPWSIARMAVWGETICATDSPPTTETVTYAKRDLTPGETIDGLGGFCTYGMIETAANARREGHLPLGLAPGSVVTNAVRAGEPVGYADVQLDENSAIVTLRRRQDVELYP